MIMPHESMLCLVRGANRPECEDLTAMVRREPAPAAAAVPPVINNARRTATAAEEPDDKWAPVKVETLSDGREVTTWEKRRSW